VSEAVGPAAVLRILQLLCEGGASVDSPSRSGETALGLAIKNCNERAVRYLMHERPAGASPDDFNFARVVRQPGFPPFKMWTFLLSTRDNEAMGRVMSSFTIRQLVLPAVVAQELRSSPGSVDEENLLGLRPATSRHNWYPGSLAGWQVSRAFPSCARSILAEIYLCHACSCQEREKLRVGTARGRPSSVTATQTRPGCRALARCPRAAVCTAAPRARSTSAKAANRRASVGASASEDAGLSTS
jgi:hypothetical protein